MLAVSTAELWQKCHGEDEKVIKALFTFGRKLKPCIIFLDEADAMLGTRKAGEKRHLRAMLNQFLMCWDGLTSDRDSPFVLLATNRPFDLDPAVLRRAPVHIEIGPPDISAREGILRLLLRAERLEPGPGSMIPHLARTTDRYTGSDLKNLCVTAATLAVDEQPEDTDVRTLTMAHFDQAMKKVRPVTLSAVTKNELDNFGKKGVAEGGGAYGMQDED
jgi:SpoVK/Ycf46/Vps4 family AAA+-type ATPase